MGAKVVVAASAVGTIDLDQVNGILTRARVVEEAGAHGHVALEEHGDEQRVEYVGFVGEVDHKNSSPKVLAHVVQLAGIDAVEELDKHELREEYGERTF